MPEVIEIVTFIWKNFDTVVILLTIAICTFAIVDKLILIWRVLDLQYRYQKLDFKLRHPNAGDGLYEDDRRYWYSAHRER